MQIILASAKIMNDRSATKGDACQSKKVKSSPDISLTSPRFQNEADCFAKDMGNKEHEQDHQRSTASPIVVSTHHANTQQKDGKDDTTHYYNT